MPSFLSKVFGRKKQDDTKDGSDASLLEGKFEAVSPTVSPTADKFTENRHNKSSEKEKEKTAFSLLRTKSGTAYDSKLSEAPQLSLHLSSFKSDAGSRTLGAVFEADPVSRAVLSEAEIGTRRLNPVEALILIRACSQAITTHGLETLGLMHPHWYSASPDVQRRLISLFIQTLASNSPLSTLSPTPSSAITAFESEVGATRSPHDVASVLRWGIRHFKLEGQSFGKEPNWYTNFFDREKSSNYPPTAFTDTLVPSLPAPHFELLKVLLDLFSSLAAHSEANSISGSKVSKLFGFWLLSTTRFEEKDTWSTFYTRWEQQARMLEHLFLASLRDEAVKQRLPRRLSELVTHYPYAQGDSSSQEKLLPRPRFSTRQYSALHVQLQTQVPEGLAKPIHHPLKLLSDALRSKTEASDNYAGVWEALKSQGVTPEDANSVVISETSLGQIFTDETVRFLSLISHDFGIAKPARPFTLLETPHRRSLSYGDAKVITNSPSNGTPNNGTATPNQSSPAPLPTISTGLDWTQFSSKGFSETPLGTPLTSTLLDKDVEVTIPRKPSKKSSGRGRKSLDALPPISTAGLADRGQAKEKEKERASTTSTVKEIGLVKLDEAFVDFWSDALLDPISQAWPRFILCKLLSGVEIDGEGEKVQWLVIEQRLTKPTPPATTAVSPSEPATTTTSTASPSTGRPRASSPKPSFSSELSATVGGTRKRFNFFSRKNHHSPTSAVESPSPLSATTTKASKKGGKSGKSPKIGEMGEILKEEDEKPAVAAALPSKSNTTKKEEEESVVVKQNAEKGKDDQKEEEKDAALSGAAVAAVVAGVGTAGVASAIPSGPPPADDPTFGDDQPQATTTDEPSEPVEASAETAEETTNATTAPEPPMADAATNAAHSRDASTVSEVHSKFTEELETPPQVTQSAKEDQPILDTAVTEPPAVEATPAIEQTPTLETVLEASASDVEVTTPATHVAEHAGTGTERPAALTEPAAEAVDVEDAPIPEAPAVNAQSDADDAQPGHPATLAEPAAEAVDVEDAPVPEPHVTEERAPSPIQLAFTPEPVQVPPQQHETERADTSEPVVAPPATTLPPVAEPEPATATEQFAEVAHHRPEPQPASFEPSVTSEPEPKPTIADSAPALPPARVPTPLPAHVAEELSSPTVEPETIDEPVVPAPRAPTPAPAPEEVVRTPSPAPAPVTVATPAPAQERSASPEPEVIPAPVRVPTPGPEPESVPVDPRIPTPEPSQIVEDVTTTSLSPTVQDVVPVPVDDSPIETRGAPEVREPTPVVEDIPVGAQDEESPIETRGAPAALEPTPVEVIPTPALDQLESQVPILEEVTPVVEPIRDPSPPLNEDASVSLDPVPVVEAPPVAAAQDVVQVSLVEDHDDEKVAPPLTGGKAEESEEEVKVPETATESVILAGSTLGPEAALDVPTIEKKDSEAATVKAPETGHSNGHSA